MWKVYILLAGFLVAFSAGVKSAYHFFNVKINKEKVLFLEDQVKKYKKAEEEASRLEAEGNKADATNQETMTNLTKELPKHDAPDRTILPSTWMQRLDRIR